jgi:hypothetical protein
MSLPVTARFHRGTHSKPQPRWFKSQHRTRNFVIDEVSFITDELIGGINKPVAVLKTR